MTELVPFQIKRKKQFKESVTLLQAIILELEKHLKKIAPDLQFSADYLPKLDEQAMVLEMQKLTEVPTLERIVAILAPVTSPLLITNAEIPWTVCRLEAPVVLLRLLASATNAKETLDVLPKPYQKIIERVYKNQETLKKLTEFLESSKRAKKYMRIWHKRLGIYKERKPPFKKVLPQT